MAVVDPAHCQPLAMLIFGLLLLAYAAFGWSVEGMPDGDRGQPGFFDRYENPFMFWLLLIASIFGGIGFSFVALFRLITS